MKEYSTASGHLKIDEGRLLESIDRLGAIGRSADGITRVALTEEDKQARDLVVERMRSLSMTVQVDRIGNIYGIRAAADGSLEAPVVTGSHIDSVIGAGPLDGSYGVLAGLEAMAVLNEAGINTRRPLAVAVFTNEEGVRYQPDMMGSLIAAGGMAVEDALEVRGTDNTRLGDELARIGYAGDLACGALQPHAFVELHIEQGPVLDTNGEEIGVVHDLQGISWTEISIEGQANHAGTTPINMRRDAGHAAAAVITGVRDIAGEMGGNQVATVGSISLTPNVINVVPSGATLTVDLRNTDEALLQQAETSLADLMVEVSKSDRVVVEQQQLARFQPVKFDEDICGIITTVAGEFGLGVRHMTSGAGHDAQMMARICPTAMIFVPSVNGISHNAAEHTHSADLVNGAKTLLNVLYRLAMAEA
jgi:N-carbamoyl-L-amino-acid hydrolase